MNEITDYEEGADVDVEVLMDQIRRYIASRRSKQAPASGEPVDSSFLRTLSPSIYGAWERAQRANSTAGLGLEVRASGLPLIGPIIDAMRRSVHQLVLFYVNRSIAHQVGINADILAALAGLVQEAERRQPGPPDGDEPREHSPTQSDG